MFEFFKNRYKISYRIAFRYGLMTLVIMFVTSLLAVISAGLFMHSQAVELLEIVANSVAEDYISHGGVQEELLIETIRLNDHVEIIIHRDGEPIFGPIKENHALVEEDDLLIYRKYFIDENNHSIMILVTKDFSGEGDFVIIMFWIMMILTVVAFFASIFIGVMLSRTILAPIEQIRRHAKEISVKDLNKRLNLEGPDDELKLLAETFNDMLSTIQDGYERQNRFALDASHELATPLAVANGYIDLIRRWGRDDEVIYEEAVDGIKREVKHMSSMLDQLLFVAKNDNDISQLEKAEFWLNELMVQIVKENKLIYPSHQLKLTNNDSIKLEADPRLIKQMFRALINNGVKYSVEDTSITLSSNQIGKVAEIRIQDEGIGIPREDLPYIFDRYYRVDKARSRESGGTGLGLSIVKWIAEVHGGSVRAESEHGKGSAFIVTLPVL